MDIPFYDTQSIAPMQITRLLGEKKSRYHYCVKSILILVCKLLANEKSEFTIKFVKL